MLQLKFQSVPCDSRARLDPSALEKALKKGDIGTVVATIGTTGTGSVDPLPDILQLQAKYGFRLHADAAYGGYFILAGNLDAATRETYRRLGEVDSLAIDPHKHGLQPYGCGCILFKDPAVGAFYKHDSPYTYFTSSDLHLGEITLECSRPGAAAVALWATQKLLPLVPGGEFASDLARCREAALLLHDKLEKDPRFITIMQPELDIVVWAPRAPRASQISQLSKEMFRVAAAQNLHLAIFNYPARLLADRWKGIVLDAEQVTCLRSCLLKPEHRDWLERIWKILDKIAAEVLPG